MIQNTKILKVGHMSHSPLVNRGSLVTQYFEFLDHDLPIYYTTFVGLNWRLRAVYRWTSPLLRPFWRKILSYKKLAENLHFWRKWDQNEKFCFRDPQKAHPWVKRHHFTYRSYKIGAGGFSVRHNQNYPPQKKLAESLYTRLHTRGQGGMGSKNHYRIVMKFCTGISVLTSLLTTNFMAIGSGVLGAAGVQILQFSIDFHCHPQNTLALLCQRVIFLTYR